MDRFVGFLVPVSSSMVPRKVSLQDILDIAGPALLIALIGNTVFFIIGRWMAGVAGTIILFILFYTLSVFLLRSAAKAQPDGSLRIDRSSRDRLLEWMFYSCLAIITPYMLLTFFFTWPNVIVGHEVIYAR